MGPPKNSKRAVTLGQVFVVWKLCCDRCCTEQEEECQNVGGDF